MKNVASFKHHLFFLITIVSAFLVFGCASTWVQKAPALQTEKNAQVLVGHYSVESNAGADMFDLGKQAEGGVSFDDVSMQTYKLMAESLKKFNFILVTDKTRAKRLDRQKELTTGNSRADELLRSMASQWTHPDTAAKPFHRIMAGTKLRKQVCDTLKGSNRDELFLSADLKIEDQDQYLFFKRFRLTLAIQILDQKGDAVFQAKSESFTGLKFLRNPISEERIQTAMADALSKLENAPVKDGVSAFSSL
ncbi:MAG: hypothetical protein ACQERN_07640 [Thermodesulfobacteriota bacterium]